MTDNVPRDQSTSKKQGTTKLAAIKTTKIETDDNSRTSRIGIITWPRIVIAALLGFILLTFAWSFVRTQTIRVLATQMVQAKAQGYQIDHEDLLISGFPTRVELISERLSIKSPSHPSPTLAPSNVARTPQHWAVTLSDISARTSILSPFSWQFEHKGAMRLDLRLANLGRYQGRYFVDIIPAPIQTFLTTNFKGQVKKQKTEIGKTKIQSLVGAAPPIMGFDRFTLQSERSGEDQFIKLRSDRVQIGGRSLTTIRELVGPIIDRFDMDFQIHNWDQLITDWEIFSQQDGSQLIGKNGRLVWGILDVKARFNFSFKHSELDGRINLEVKNLNEIIDRLSQTGNISPLLAPQLKRLTNRLEMDNQGRQEIELSVQNRKIKYGFLTLHKY